VTSFPSSRYDNSITTPTTQMCIISIAITIISTVIITITFIVIISDVYHHRVYGWWHIKGCA
jgi:hypothetical protein